jgi:hypothetical protein
MLNPYENHGANLENSATRVFPIAIPADDLTPLAQVIKALRIWNPDAAAAHTVSYITSKGDSVVVSVPANTLWVEHVVIQQVNKTGTYAGLILHGYSD